MALGLCNPEDALIQVGPDGLRKECQNSAVQSAPAAKEGAGTIRAGVGVVKIGKFQLAGESGRILAARLPYSASQYLCLGLSHPRSARTAHSAPTLTCSALEEAAVVMAPKLSNSTETTCVLRFSPSSACDCGICRDERISGPVGNERVVKSGAV